MIVVGIVAFVLLIIGVVCIVFNTRNKKNVLENSQKIKSLLEMNEQYSFIKIQPDCSTFTCKTKRQFDSFNFQDFMLNKIEEYESYYEKLINGVNYNRVTYDKYIHCVDNIKFDITEESCREIGVKFKKFIKIEKRIFDKKILGKPDLDLAVKCFISYTSPKGRNHYRDYRIYDYAKISSLFVEMRTIRENKKSKQYQIKMERLKMSDSLRYDILRRDNFRCQLCGASAKDGVQLHIDHIVPVSKGGKTEPKNLRTLCDRCNMGKGAKLE